MKKSSTLFLIGFVLVAGLVLIPFVGVQGQIFRWQNYAGVYETPTPGPGGASLLIDFTHGLPGSFFTVHGYGYAPNVNASVRINDVPVGSVSTDALGELEVFLDTNGASLGRYDVAIIQGSDSADTGFLLIPVGEQHPLNGAGTIIGVPPGIAVLESFLPFIHR